jgi:glycerophosphoryl diester phosphodiesterase
MMDSVETYIKANNLAPINYLIEIKSNAKTDGLNQPEPEEFATKVMDVLKPLSLGSRLIIQSFDPRPLKVLHRRYPNVALGFLNGDKKVSFEQSLVLLGFIPTFYNPNSNLVNLSVVQSCHDKGVLITPWTVNDLPEMKKIKALKVDGIITDYPNHFSDL